MFLLAQYWPVLAVVVIGTVPLIGILLWAGRLSLSQIAVYLSIEIMLAIAAQQILTDAGFIGVFAGEYNGESVEAFTQICLIGCQSPPGQETVCPRYCGCLVRQAQSTMEYQDMLTRMVGLASEDAEQTWARNDRFCRQNLGLR